MSDFSYDDDEWRLDSEDEAFDVWQEDIGDLNTLGIDMPVARRIFRAGYRAGWHRGYRDAPYE